MVQRWRFCRLVTRDRDVIEHPNATDEERLYDSERRMGDRGAKLDRMGAKTGT